MWTREEGAGGPGGTIVDAVDVSGLDRAVEERETKGIQVVGEVAPQPDEPLQAADVMPPEAGVRRGRRGHFWKLHRRRPTGSAAVAGSSSIGTASRPTRPLRRA